MEEPPFEAQVVAAQAEMVLDSLRLVGELRHMGVPRRLVDLLNGIEGSFIVLHDVMAYDPREPEASHRHFDIIHVQRDAILFAIPRGASVAPPTSFEKVTKVPVPATIVLPIYQITGNVHVAPGIDAAASPILASKRFMPVTEASITGRDNQGEPWQEPIVVVNLARAQAYAPDTSGPTRPD